MSVNLNGKVLFTFADNIETLTHLKNEIESQLGLSSAEYYLISNGKIVNESSSLLNCPIHIVPRLIGGKGGFGSMLRAIGAQIEKTTNREACRDLSGRRLRDINEEKRLKTWIAQQVEREQEADDRRQKKLERLCQTPKHVFKDANYEKERSELPEKAEDALEQGLKASCGSGKRKLEDKTKKNKKVRLWVGSEDELSSSIESESEDEEKSSNKSFDISSKSVIMEESSSSKDEEIQKNVEDSTINLDENEKISKKEEGIVGTIGTNKLIDDTPGENEDAANTIGNKEEHLEIIEKLEVIEEKTKIAVN